MRIGADYYPEHWEKERWKTDAEMMVKANIKVIRIGEFAWSLYEPEEGKYEFASRRILNIARGLNILMPVFVS